MQLKKLEEQLRALRQGFVTLGRLHALELLGENRLKEKRRIASLTVAFIEAGAVIDDFIKRYYLPKSELVFWEKEFHPETQKIIYDDRIRGDILKKKCVSLKNDINRTLKNLTDSLSSEELLSPVLPVLSSLEDLVKVNNEGIGKLLSPPACRDDYGFGIKVVNGPLKVEMDPAFVPTYSLLKAPVPSFGETVKENVPYFWGLAIRESLAGDLCALCIIEYDVMPLQFYRDMAKQSWDEMRHSTFFFDMAIKLLPNLKKSLASNDPLQENISRFLETGTGLPIPKERNLYEAILNANLVERLILLHRDTETPGIMRIKEKINSSFCAKYPEIAEALKIVLRDEITHSRFGHVWLNYLLPNKKIREAEIQTTEMLRGVFLLASFAHYDKTSLGSLMKEYAGGKKAPVSKIQNTLA